MPIANIIDLLSQDKKNEMCSIARPVQGKFAGRFNNKRSKQNASQMLLKASGQIRFH